MLCQIQQRRNTLLFLRELIGPQYSCIYFPSEIET